MKDDLDSAPGAATRHNSFWVCLLVFAALAVDSGLRLARALEQRTQLVAAQAGQAASLARASAALAQLPQVESKLEALTLDLIHLGRTNPVAAQLIREFNINWTPGSRTNLPAAVPVPPTNSPSTQ